jgi:hypothetical protein
MSTLTADYDRVLEQVRRWPPDARLALAEDLLRSLHNDVRPVAPRGVPLDQVLGVAAGKGPPPDDEAVRRWIGEHRLGKHG